MLLAKKKKLKTQVLKLEAEFLETPKFKSTAV